jgi:hypothetical protein
MGYGKQAINHQQDFQLLRLRMGYACFMQKKYTEALRQYEAILKKDSYQETARYYSWLCLLKLQQPEIALWHASYLPDVSLKQERIKKNAITGIDWESSYKTTDLTTRFDAMYNRIGLSVHLGWKWSMYNAVAFFQQKLDEPGLLAVKNNRSISIDQTEFYHLSTIQIDRRWQIKLGYHYLNTPFNNFTFQNHIGIAGIKYNLAGLQLQASVYAGILNDSSYHQLNLQANYYPLGNDRLYGISTISSRKYGQDQQINFKQVVGVKIRPKIWMEMNATMGRSQNYAENDALYVYNAIDYNNIKAGGTLYTLINKKFTFQLGYTFEQRNLFIYPNLLFYQHSINGGIKCTL